MSETPSLKPWQVLSSRVTYKDRWLTLRTDDCLTGHGVHIEAYHVLEYPGWINVVALTEDLRLVLIREYRHGLGEIVPGLVGGTVETSDAGPEPALETARRELTEETGYLGGRFELLAESYPNPATQANRVSSFLAVGVRPGAERFLDAAEEIEVYLDDLPSVLIRLRDNELQMQAMHIAALWLAAARIMAGQVEGTEPLRAALLDVLTGKRNS